MSEVLKVFNNIRTLRAQARETDLATLEEMLEKLSVVVSERREEIASEQLEIEAKEEKLKMYREMLLADGIDVSDLMSSTVVTNGKAKSKREPRPAKYSYTNDEGVTQTWTGQGRMPKAIAQAVEAGRSLSEFEL